MTYLTRLSTRLALLISLTVGLTFPADGKPTVYRLNTDTSIVGFSYDFQGNTQQGTMPIKSADLVVDIRNISASKLDVTLDATGAKAALGFITSTMKSGQVLDTRNHPTIRFQATRITGTLSDATMTGNVTIRGITRPITLKGGVFTEGNQKPGDFSELTILMTGGISRKSFGADGFPGLVGDAIGLRIIARIEK